MFEPHEYEVHAKSFRTYTRWSITLTLVVLCVAVLAMWATSCYDQPRARIIQQAPAVVLDQQPYSQPVIVTQPDNSLTNMLLLHSIMNSGPDTVVHEHYHAPAAAPVVTVRAPQPSMPQPSAASRVQFSAPARVNAPSAASRVTFSAPPAARSSPSSASRVSFSGGKR